MAHPMVSCSTIIIASYRDAFSGYGREREKKLEDPASSTQRFQEREDHWGIGGIAIPMGFRCTCPKSSHVLLKCIHYDLYVVY